MRIIVDKAIPFITDRIKGENEIFFLPASEITPDKVKDADILVIRTRTKCNSDLLKESRVKLISTATIGTDHIDMPWCESNGITVKNAPGCNAPGVAQYVFASLFKTGFDPTRHTLGIIGYGNVGSIVAAWAQKMNIKTLISDAPRKIKGYSEVNYVDPDFLLRNSDAVTIHVPFTNSGNFPTENLIGGEELDMMKPGAILVNSSRGGVVNEKSLKENLKSGKIKTILDVWVNEPEIDRELVELASIATPHIAGYSAEGKMRATRMALESLRDNAGITVDISGLECMPEKDKIISKELIEESYNPFIDSDNLKNNIAGFEDMRNKYPYRHEPLFI